MSEEIRKAVIETVQTMRTLERRMSHKLSD
jgi:hypothetical protein